MLKNVCLHGKFQASHTAWAVIADYCLSEHSEGQPFICHSAIKQNPATRHKPLDKHNKLWIAKQSPHTDPKRNERDRPVTWEITEEISLVWLHFYIKGPERLL